MDGSRTLRRGLTVAVIGLAAGGNAVGPFVFGQEPQGRPSAEPRAPIGSSADRAASYNTPVGGSILQALATNPITSPYVFSARDEGGRIVLRGRVGSKTVYDAAVQTALAVTPRFTERLVIDTTVAHELAARSVGPVNAGYAQAVPPGVGPGFPSYGGGGPYGLGLGSGSYFAYPPPLFGYYDDPFWGMEPPVLSYPPWWGELSQRRLAEAPPWTPPPVGPFDPNQGNVPASGGSTPVADTTVPGQIDMMIDPRGVAVLRGTVQSIEDRVAIGQRIAQVPGVSQVVNLLTVGSEDRGPAVGADALDTREAVPPPPEPDPEPEVPQPPRPGSLPEPTTRRVIVPQESEAQNRLIAALRRRPDLDGQEIRAAVVDGVATLEGEVPSAFEAMIAYRAAEQVPGVRSVDDRLHFPVPNNRGRDNPLVLRGRPEDVEPYVLAQVRRQVGDAAHVDRVRVVGDRLEITGTTETEEDRRRVEAILRSMPVLRGFTLDARFVAEAETSSQLDGSG